MKLMLSIKKNHHPYIRTNGTSITSSLYCRISQKELIKNYHVQLARYSSKKFPYHIVFVQAINLNIDCNP